MQNIKRRLLGCSATTMSQKSLLKVEISSFSKDSELITEIMFCYPGFTEVPDEVRHSYGKWKDSVGDVCLDE